MYIDIHNTEDHIKMLEAKHCIKYTETIILNSAASHYSQKLSGEKKKK